VLREKSSKHPVTDEESSDADHYRRKSVGTQHAVTARCLPNLQRKRTASHRERKRNGQGRNARGGQPTIMGRSSPQQQPQSAPNYEQPSGNSVQNQYHGAPFCLSGGREPTLQDNIIYL